MGTVLLIEDDDRIRRALTMALEDEGYVARGCATAEEGLAAQRREAADTVLVDLMLPGMDGYACIRELRRHDDVPVVVISARGDTQDIVAGLEAGADDYIVKPVAVKELAARLRALHRRARPAGADALTFGDLEVRPRAGVVLRAGAPLALTRTEFLLLCALAERAGQVVSREELLRQVWGYARHTGDERVVDAHIGRLRLKVEPDPAVPRHLVTVRGLGFKLQR